VSTPAPTVSQSLQWQYYDGAAWQPFGEPFDLGSLVRTRRAGIAPRQSATAQVWRLIKLAGHDWGTAHFTADAVQFWREGPNLSAVRVRSFNFDDADQRYFHIHTYGNIEVYHRDQRVASIATPYDSAQVLQFTKAEVLDTLLTFHALTQTRKITRQGAHNQWDSRPLTYLTVPVFDYNGDRAGGVNEVQELHFKTYANGDTFNITLEAGHTTDSIVYSNVGATLAASVQAALEALPNIGAGGVVAAAIGTDVIRVTFQGDNAADDIGEMAPRTLVSTSGLAYAATTTQGIPGGEAIISDARGWPGCGTFFQGRLWLGGLKSRPQTVLGSRVGKWFNFKSQGTDTAVSEDLDTAQTTIIRDIFAGPHLQLFTSSAEFFAPAKPIVPPTAIDSTTNRGVEWGVPLASVPGGDGSKATMFVVSGGRALAEFLPISASIDTRYSAQLVSKFATHLLDGMDPATQQPTTSIVDMSYRRAKSTIEADRCILVRGDGVAAVMHTIRDDNVTGFYRWTTRGLWVSAGADLARDEYVAARRGAEVMIEKVSETALFDSQVSGVVGVSTLLMPHLAGQTVAIYRDGTDFGDFLVPENGEVPFPDGRPALREAFGGLLFAPEVITLPAVLEEDKRAGKGLNALVVRVDIKLGPTSNLQLGLKGGTLYDVPLKRAADLADGFGPGDDAFQGWTELPGLGGFRPDAQLRFYQPRPGPFMLKQVVLTVDT
jgi:hypothetical protein